MMPHTTLIAQPPKLTLVSTKSLTLGQLAAFVERAQALGFPNEAALTSGSDMAHPVNTLQLGNRPADEAELDDKGQVFEDPS
jgi:hypothetical protein